MDEDITIINTNTRNEKIKNFFVNNKKKLIILLSIIILLFLSYFAFGEIKKRSNEINVRFSHEKTKYGEQNDHLIIHLKKRNGST